ncbi:MAG: PEP-utilizing enzyme [bacterium]|nr:PEP-utilizing enzyme [bacterium]
MTKEQIKKKVLAFNDWEFWFNRPFGAFLMSCFKGGQSRKYMRNAGVDVEWPAILFQNSAWFKSEKVWNIFEAELKKYGKDKVFEVVKYCENYAKPAEKRIIRISKISASPKEKLLELYDIFTQVASFIWLAHGMEHLYNKILHEEAPKYMTGDVEKNIGDISFPKKKNANFYFEQVLKSNLSLEKVRQRFGWIKARGGFADGFSIKELAVERNRLKAESKKDKKFVRPRIHPKLKDLAAIAQELVYFRTLRTDILFELMWIARPVLTEIAKSFGLTFKELQDYSIFDLVKGELEKYEYEKFSAISYGKELALLHEPIFFEKARVGRAELKGAVAFEGVVSGIVKVVMTAQEIEKVNMGDILVAPTTAPSFIFGMRKAAAFVTDEGGITSHAAIVAREMKKPCIIGTKIATKVFKDGDLVEVDANKGIVKIINPR